MKENEVLIEIPAPIRFYFEKGKVESGHLIQLIRLKGVYGDVLMLDPQFIPTYGKHNIEKGGKEAIRYLINDIRPEEDSMPCGTPEEIIIEACMEFAEYSFKNQGHLKQWIVAAFWWASQAVSLKLSVSELTRCLEAWEERYFHAKIWWINHCDKKPTENTDEEYFKMWWGYRCDLKQSSSLFFEQLTEKELFEAEMRIYKSGGYILPTTMQPKRILKKLR